MSNGPISQTAGAKVVIDDPNTIPRPDENGIDLQPNTANSISVKKVNRASSSHLRTMLPGSSSRPLPAKWPNQAT